MAEKTKILIIALTLTALGVVMVIFGFNNTPSSSPSKPPELIQEQSQTEASLSGFLVTRVIDGDTIEIEGREKVRYIGIDTPETVDPRKPVACFGKEASEENKKLVLGKAIILEKDISETDKFGRLLRYVYIKEKDGKTIFVNDYLVREGYAKASTFPPDVKFANQFLLAEKEARETKKGLWQKCP